MITVPFRRILVALPVSFVLMSCSGQPPPSGPVRSGEAADLFLPAYGPMNALPTAELSGRLIVQDGCIWLEHDGGRALPLWPRGTLVEREGDRLDIIHGGDRARVGTQISGGGGEYGPENYAFVVELIGREVPEACRGDDIYWLVYDVKTTN